MQLRVTRARKIYSDGKHNAFTGIAAYRGMTYVSFRSAQTHLTWDGNIKVIQSADRETWSVIADESMPELDLRDPKLAVFGDRLLAYCGARRPEATRKSLCLVSADGKTFGEPVEVKGLPEGQWLWAVAPCGETLYGTAYWATEGKYAASLYASGDGLQWNLLCELPIGASETSIDFGEDGTLWALARDDNYGCVPALLKAKPPYTQFDSVTRPPIRLQGPMVKRLPGGCAIVCRQWDLPERRNLRTNLLWLGDGEEIRLVSTLPSGGDTSYAGWLDVGDGKAVISYYSSHEHKMDEPHDRDEVFAEDSAEAEHTTGADIFLANISYA